MTKARSTTRIKSFGGYILIGVLTAAPLGITWVILDFLFDQLSRIGRPLVTSLARAIAPDQPLVAAWMDNDTFVSILAAAAVLLLLWALGFAATRVVGRQLIAMFERVIGIVPFVDKIYRATKKFLTVAGTTPEGERRVVLIDFPSPEMKAVGLVTKILRDADTGEELASVYVPTSPNPTSGYIEIVPLRQITYTDWTFDEAMSFIVTGGSNSPDTVTYFTRRSAPPPLKSEPPSSET